MRAGQHAAWLREVVLDAVALILPVECAGCGLPDRDLCSDCRDALRSQSLVLPGGFPIVAGARYERELEDGMGARGDLVDIGSLCCAVQVALVDQCLQL